MPTFVDWIRLGFQGCRLRRFVRKARFYEFRDNAKVTNYFKEAGVTRFYELAFISRIFFFVIF